MLLCLVIMRRRTKNRKLNSRQSWYKLNEHPYLNTPFLEMGYFCFSGDAIKLWTTNRTIQFSRPSENNFCREIGSLLSRLPLGMEFLATIPATSLIIVGARRRCVYFALFCFATYLSLCRKRESASCQVSKRE